MPNMLSSMKSLFILVTFIIHTEATFRQPPPLCKSEPKWTINDEEYLDKHRGSVVLLFTVELHCDQCRHQLMHVKSLISHMHSLGMYDVNVVIVAPNNQSHEWVDLWRHQFGQYTRNVHVYKENTFNAVWHTLDANNGDVFVYDRCSRLNYKLSTPMSAIAQHEYVTTSLHNVYYGQPCGFCEADPRHELRKQKLPIHEPKADDARKFWEGARRNVGRTVPTIATWMNGDQRAAVRYPTTTYRPPSYRRLSTQAMPFEFTSRTAFQTTTSRQQPMSYRTTTTTPTPVAPPTPPRRLRNDYITGSTIKPFFFPHSEQTTRQREDEERRVQQARWEAAERERQAADRIRVAEEHRQRHYHATTTSTTTTTTTSTTTRPPRRQIAATYAPRRRTSTSPYSARKYVGTSFTSSDRRCRRYTDAKCLAELKNEMAGGGAMSECCTKGVYLSGACEAKNCLSDPEEAYKTCCVQKLIRSRYKCCHDNRLHGERSDEFSKCCYDQLVWDAPDDPCCPKHIASKYWKDETPLFQLCLPNIAVDFSPIKTSMAMADGRVDVMDLGDPELKNIWKYECPYSKKRNDFFYYQPVNDTNPFEINDEGEYEEYVEY